MSNFIKETWDSKATTYGDSHWASWGDNFAISLEIENISSFIKDGDTVLDVGCANGYSAFEQLKRAQIHITGIDFSEKMIEIAESIRNKEENIKNKLKFTVGDIRKLDFKDESFDVTYTTRVLINLPTWEEQVTGILECIRVTKQGGLIILSEAFWEPLVLMNSLRALLQLPPLLEHDFNRYLKKDKLKKLLDDNSLKYEIIDFSSIYYLGSRFLRELVTEVGDYPGYSNPINQIFYNIEKEYSGGGFGIQQAFVILR